MEGAILYMERIKISCERGVLICIQVIGSKDMFTLCNSSVMSIVDTKGK